MKSKVVLIALFMSTLISTVHAQDKKFLKGGWRTNGQSSAVKISHLNDKIRIFKISSISLDQHDAVFELVVDGKKINAYLQEGGELFVEGKDIYITQITSGQIHQGLWEVVDDATKYLSMAKWRYEKLPSQNKVVVAVFNEPRAFVLDFNQTIGCSNGKMKVYVDGNAIKALNNTELEYYERSSIMGKGKKVEVVVNGTCSGDAAFLGSIQFIK